MQRQRILQKTKKSRTIRFLQLAQDTPFEYIRFYRCTHLHERMYFSFYSLFFFCRKKILNTTHGMVYIKINDIVSVHECFRVWISNSVIKS